MRLHLASVFEWWELYPKMQTCKYILESFYWFDGIRKDKQRYFMSQINADNFLLDSGAYSFMNAQKGKSINFEEYLKRYVDFINRFNVKYFFELDLDSVIGFEKTMEMTKVLEKATRKKCIPVFHKSRGLKEWERLCRDYDYVAIGTIYEYRRKERVLIELLKIANKYNTKVHGLGFTSCKNLERVRFYSVDSTSWKIPMRSGTLAQFNGREILTISGPKGYRLKDYKKSGRMSVDAWLEYQKYVEKYL